MLLKLRLKEELLKAKAEGCKIIWADETMFTRKAVKKTEWSRKGENAEVDEKLLNDYTKALLMGISEEEGVEQWMIFKKSVNTDKFVQYLLKVRAANGKREVALFMDNLQVHKTKIAR